MPWFKVDDHFWSHPKTAELSDGATALWLRAGSWSAGHLTDGRIPVSMLRMFRARRRSADELVTVGLWSIDGDTFVFHSWHEYQPSKAQVESKREATRNRVNAWRERHGNGVTNAPGDDEGNTTPDPTRPDPTRPSTSDEVEGGPRKRGTRIPEPFMLTTEMRDWAATETPTVDAEASTRRFVDYWRAETGAKASKLDWVATWRNWLRRDADAKKPNRLTPTERAAQTAAAGRQVMGQQITSLEIEQ